MQFLLDVVKFEDHFCLFGVDKYDIASSAHRNSRLKKPNEMQQYADIYLLPNYSTCFGRPSRPSSGVHKTVVVASGTDHTMWGASFFRRDQIRTHRLMVVSLVSMFSGTIWLYSFCAVSS